MLLIQQWSRRQTSGSLTFRIQFILIHHNEYRAYKEEIKSDIGKMAEKGSAKILSMQAVKTVATIVRINFF